MYAIIEFLDERNIVEMVPSSWLVDSKTCYWPPRQVKHFEVATYIKKARKPELSWQRFPIKIVGEASTFNEARKKVKKASILSDLEGHLSSTDSEMCGRGKRRRQCASQVLIGSSDEEEENAKKRKLEGLTSLPSGSSNGNFGMSGSVRFEERTSASKEISYGSSDDDRNVTMEKIIESLPTQPKSLEFSKKFYSTSNELHRAIPAVSSNGSDLELILKQINYLRHDVKELRTSVDKMSERMLSDTDKASKLPDSKITYPIETVDVMIKLEEECNDKNLRSCLVNKLRSFGGSNYGDHTRRILRFLFNDQFIMNYSWQGSKDKQQFSKLEISNVIVDAVCEDDKQVSRSLVERAIKCWLRHAKERTAYRKLK